MIQKDKAIVLKVIDYQDSSKIAQVLTQDSGKVSLIAKGVKKPKSKLAGFLQSGNIIEIVYYKKNNRSIQILKESSFITKAYPLHYDMDKLSILMPTLELVEQLVNDQEETEAIFLFISGMIKWLISEKRSVATIFPYIQIRLMELVGIQLNWEKNHIDTDATQYYLNIADGSITNKTGEGLSFKLTKDQAMYSYLSCSRKGQAILDQNFEIKEIKNLIHHFDVYFKQHIEGIRDRKSDDIFKLL